MTIADIPSDELVVMTENLYRAFCAAGCKPACHGCDKKLKAGKQFMLASIQRAKDSVDVMLCDLCKPRDAIAEKVRPIGTGCFRVNGKVQLTV